MLTLISVGLLGLAGVILEIPQKLYKKNKEKIDDGFFWLREKTLRAKKYMGTSNSKNELEFERIKTERAIEKLIKVISSYKALSVECDVEMDKLRKSGVKEEDIKFLEITKAKIEEDYNVAKIKLEEQKEQLRQLRILILSSDIDHVNTNIQTSKKDNSQYLSIKSYIDALKEKKSDD
jgi:hypothetical protein